MPLDVCIHSSRAALGEAAATSVAASLRAACMARGGARAIFACAPSQDEFLAALLHHEVPWRQVTIFHMDEYVGLGADHPQTFWHYLSAHLLAGIGKPRAVHRLAASEAPAQESARYAALLTEAPIDLVCLGIGENGHLAFNDPPVADFHDPHLVKTVKLDPACRHQQVHDGCFPTFEAVPTHALSLTIPALLGAREISCVVPGERKAEAVRQTLHGPIATACPASILRRHPRAVLHLDPASAALLPK